MVRFIALFLALVVGLFSLEVLQPVQQHVILPFTAILAKISVGLISLFDADAIASGKVIRSATTGLGVSIEPGCNGVEACIILFAGVMAYPAPLRLKLAGLAIGFVAIQGLNLIRIISLYYLAAYDSSLFDFFHFYLWQALIMLDVLVVWLLWIRHVARQELADAAPA